MAQVAAEQVPGVAKFGARLRLQRERVGISVRELARRIGVSPSLVSQIERDIVHPSVSTLYALVTELGLTMSDVFAEPPRPRLPLQPERAETAGPVTAPGSRQAIHLAAGVHWERLTPSYDPLVEFLFVVYEPGGESCPADALMRHGGREYGYVIEGRLGLRIGFDDYVLEPGASISFDSSSPHRLYAVGTTPVRAIWTVVGRQADPRAPTLSVHAP
jgi:transcriptional regulator with XRE-family HTH domain